MEHSAEREIKGTVLHLTKKQQNNKKNHTYTHTQTKVNKANSKKNALELFYPHSFQQ